MAEQTTTRHKVSFEEYEAKYAGRRYEYVDGYAVPMGPEIIDENGEITVSPTKPKHGRLSAKLAALIFNFVEMNKLGSVFGAETEFIMEPEIRQIRAADVAFYSSERAKHIDPDDWLPFPPDLAVEIISQYEKAADIRKKALSYMEQGTRLLLLVFPDSRVIDVYRPDQPIHTLKPGDTLDGGDVLQGFYVPVADIFAVLD